MTIQIMLIITIPLLILYSTIIFCYGYKKGHTEGFNIGIKALEKLNKIEKIRKEYQGAYPEDFWYLIKEVLEEKE